jgi:hypothetical protein
MWDFSRKFPQHCHTSQPFMKGKRACPVPSTLFPKVEVYSIGKQSSPEANLCRAAVICIVAELHHTTFQWQHKKPEFVFSIVVFLLK